MAIRVDLDKALSWPTGVTHTDEGGRGYHEYPPSLRHLRVMAYGRRLPVNREVTVTTADGRVRILSASLRIPGRHRTTVEAPTPGKRQRLALGAVYGDSWQRSADADNTGERRSLAKPGGGDSVEWAN